MRIVMPGTGYVGLVSGLYFSHFGRQAVGVDEANDNTERLQAGKVRIYESGADVVLTRNVEARFELCSGVRQ
jgi:UDPglucose 6-dehydrogenase